MRRQMLYLLLLCFPTIQAMNILVTTLGTASSQNILMAKVADILAKDGHNVTLWRWELFPEILAPKLEYANEISYKAVEDEGTVEELRKYYHTFAWVKEEAPPLAFMRHILPQYVSACDRLLRDERKIEELRKKNFDFAIIHLLDFCPFKLTEILGIQKYAWFSTGYMPDIMAEYSGTPMVNSYVPSALHQVTDVMDFAQRTKNLLANFVSVFMSEKLVATTYTRIFRNVFGENTASLRDLLEHSDGIYVNMDPFFEYSRPTLNNVVFVGGLGVKKADILEEKWREIAENAKKLVLFSLGSVSNTFGMPFELKENLVNAFKKFPEVTFIARLEGDLPDINSTSNIILTNWFPQKDLLGQPKTAAFITHGGLNSLIEANYMGVPVIVIPLFADQMANTKRIERKEIGCILDKRNLTENNVFEALETVLYSERIQENADRLAAQIQSRKEGPSELLRKSVSKLARTRTLKHSRIPKQNFIKFYNLDAIVLMLACIIISTYYSIRMFISCYLVIAEKKDKAKLAMQSNGKSK